MLYELKKNMNFAHATKSVDDVYLNRASALKKCLENDSVEFEMVISIQMIKVPLGEVLVLILT